jgi:Cu/Ag efflux pump CusA
VGVLASDTREIEVIVDPAKMIASKLTVDDVSAALTGANLLQPVGHYPENGLQHLVLASGLWKSIDDIGNTPVVVKGGTTLKVSDIAPSSRARPIARQLIAGQDGNATAISQQIGAALRRTGLEMP